MTLYLEDVLRAGLLAGKSRDEIFKDYRDIVADFRMDFKTYPGHWVETMARARLVQDYLTEWQRKRGI